MAETATTDPVIEEGPYGGRTEIFAIPATEAFLQPLLEDLFRNHWDKIVFGPIIQGGAYEIRAEQPPHSITLNDGYLTIWFGASHFHLCIGDNHGSAGRPTPEGLRRERRTGRAEFFRGLDDAGCPCTWGLRLFNGAGDQQMTIFLPNAFIGDNDDILPAPDWSRLALWEDLGRRYLGREPDGRDRTGAGFSHTG